MAKLFEKLKIGNLELQNRIIIAPMCQYSAENGNATPWHLMHLGRMMLSGAGLFIIEATAVTPCGRISYGDLGLYSDENESNLKRVISDVRKYSTMPIAIQLAHAGRKASTVKGWETGGQLPPEHVNGWQTIAPTALPFNENDLTPKEMTIDDIKNIKSSFVSAAKRAVNSGVQGIEIHAAHGYLLHQFLSPLSNFRKDEYGGSLENRMHLLLEIFTEMREAIQKNIPIWVRISATDWVVDGWDIEQSIILAKKLKNLGCDAIHVSSGGLDKKQQIKVEEHYQVDFAKRIKEEVGILTIAVGLISDPVKAENILVQKQADAIGIARSILFNPHWPWDAAIKLKAKVKCPDQYLRCRPHGVENFFENV